MHHRDLAGMDISGDSDICMTGTHAVSVLPLASQLVGWLISAYLLQTNDMWRMRRAREHTWKGAGALMSIIERTACAVTGATRSLSTMKGISTACAVCTARTASKTYHKRVPASGGTAACCGDMPG